MNKKKKTKKDNKVKETGHLKGNKKKLKDPHAQREARKYENPIPSRELILQVLADSSGPLSRKALIEKLNLHSYEQKEALRRRLIAMERDGQLISNRRGAYGPLDKMDLVRGRVQGHKDGYGFLIPFDSSNSDIYLANRQMRKVFDGDEVLVRTGGMDSRGRLDGSIVEVVSHNTTHVVGRLVIDSGIYFVRPDNPRIVQDILIPPGEHVDAENGQIVNVEIIDQPSRNNRPKGRVAEVLGDHLAPGMEIDVAIRSHEIPNIWPPEVKEASSKLSAKVSAADKRHRVDLRELPLVTIDGEDARDFDDAVFCERKKSGGWRLYVAIADVSHYVKVGSPLDAEALNRGNSVYFPDFVVPMLPEALSNGLCSLNPEVDRLCMVCEMTISAKGKVSGYHFYEGLMHSHARLTYTQVGKMIGEAAHTKEGKQLRAEFEHVVDNLDDLHDLYGALRATREMRGAIDFETVETRIIFDEQRKIKEIIPVQRNDAHKLIEECMLAANVCAARFLSAHDIPALFRVHESPKEQKLTNLREFLSELGLSIDGGDQIEPKHFQAVMAQVEGRADAHIIQTVLLRSMNQAVYRPDNHGHFGLAYDAYAHFTSPIRRYPDLLVHRAIRSVIRSSLDTRKVVRVEGAKPMKKAKIYPYEMAEMIALGEQCSITERRADEATRDVVRWLKCEYLKDRIGETFVGVVSAVTSFGLFVELNDLYVEGLVHVTALPQDYYHHVPAQHRLVGERTRQTFELGDELVVNVVRVSLDERKVDFEIVEKNKSKARKPRKRNVNKRDSDAVPPEGKQATKGKKTKRPAGAQSKGRGKPKSKAKVEKSADTKAKTGKKLATNKSKVSRKKSKPKKG